VAHRMDGLRASAEAPAEPVPIESLGYESEADVVPIESLAPDAVVPPSPVESKAPPSGLENSFRTLETLIRNRAPGSPVLSSLLGGAPAPAPSPAITAAEVEAPAVAIDSLCYSGYAALERANTVRHQITAQLSGNASLESLQPLLQELLDLVPLALAES
jgi:hypothetical protein